MAAKTVSGIEPVHLQHIFTADALCANVLGTDGHVPHAASVKPGRLVVWEGAR